MEVPVAVIADAANISQEGNLNIVGVFNSVWSLSFPVQVPAVVVVQLRGGEEDAGDHSLLITLDDREDVRIALPFSFPPGRPDVVVNHVVRLSPLTILEPVRHVFHVIVDGVERASIPVTGTLSEPPAAQE